MRRKNLLCLEKSSLESLKYALRGEHDFVSLIEYTVEHIEKVFTLLIKEMNSIRSDEHYWRDLNDLLVAAKQRPPSVLWYFPSTILHRIAYNWKGFMLWSGEKHCYIYRFAISCLYPDTRRAESILNQYRSVLTLRNLETIQSNKNDQAQVLYDLFESCAKIRKICDMVTRFSLISRDSRSDVYDAATGRVIGTEEAVKLRRQLLDSVIILLGLQNQVRDCGDVNANIKKAPGNLEKSNDTKDEENNEGNDDAKDDFMIGESEVILPIVLDEGGSIIQSLQIDTKSPEKDKDKDKDSTSYQPKLAHPSELDTNNTFSEVEHLSHRIKVGLQKLERASNPNASTLRGGFGSKHYPLGLTDETVLFDGCHNSYFYYITLYTYRYIYIHIYMTLNILYDRSGVTCNKYADNTKKSITQPYNVTL